ncbi:MAG: carboxypeptidase regulatory-like domain-containing protein [Gemmatimonadales bacterium]
MIGLTLLTLALVPNTAPAQAAKEGNLRLLVLDDETGEPIEGAFVRIKGRSPDVTTNAKGRVTIEKLPAGKLTCEIGAIGYEMRREPMLIQEGSDLERKIGLGFTGERLPDVVVEARQEKLYPRYSDFHRRAKTGAGFYITWREIHARGYSRLGDVLRTVRGVEVRCRPNDCLILMSRSTTCPPAVWVDGRPSDFYGANTAIGDIYGMEVYRGPSEMPAEFVGNSMCGALVLWTKNRPYR